MRDHAALVARVKYRGVDGQAIRGDGEGARRIPEERYYLEGNPADRVAWSGRVENPYIRAGYARRYKLWVASSGYRSNRRMRAMLAAMRSRNKRAIMIRSGKDNVAWLVAYEQRAGDTSLDQIYDAHAIRQVIDDPDLSIAPGRYRDRLHPDRY
jgi:hypothetical protein